MPISPPFSSGSLNPCVATSTGALKCLPYVHVISGWHMFDSESLGWLKHVKALETRGGGGCFADWANDAGGGSWAASFGGPPSSDSVIMAHCNKLLSWYPAFAGRYTSAWGKEYGACKERELHKPGDYYSQRMWPICRPAAMLAHDRAMGRGGAGQEATPPFVMRTLYGQGRAKVSPPCR